jgi:preprotein translocase subunit SecA
MVSIKASAADFLWQSRRARNELVEQALSAQHLFQLDKHYIVADSKVQIVDEYTGRVMPDRSWERGLHQMIEAKEGCDISGQRRTQARITYQRFFRRYLRLSGMSGTVGESTGEFWAVYGLKVVRIPTHRPLRRRHLGTSLSATGAEKWKRVIERALEMRRIGRPVRDRSQRRNRSAVCCQRPGYPTRCSTPGRTSRRPTSSRRPARPAVSR